MGIMFRKRYLRILWFFAMTLLSILGWDLILPRIGLGQWARQTRSARMRQMAASFRVLAIQMGGVLIKMGQFLSSRMDVLPPEIIEELAGLQDEVSPESFEHVRQVVESEFGRKLEERFINFEVKPLASASIGQVHRAHLRLDEDSTGSASLSVVVKVQRPDITRIVEVDLSALQIVAHWVEWYQPIRKRVNVKALLEEFGRSLHEEIDYLCEGKNAETFAENFAGQEDVVVPRVFWSHTTRRVLTLEDVMAIKISDYASIDAAGVSRKAVAERLFAAYLKQIFDDRFFHADPHPGNLFVLPGDENNEDGTKRFKLVFVDFGMVGRIPPGTFAGLRELFIGVGLRDSARVVKAYQMLDIILPGTDTRLLEKAANRLFERLWGKTAPELMEMHAEEAQVFLNEFGDLIYEMPFQIPENLILFGRCLAILSGICSGLDYEFNVFTNLQPYANKLISEEGGSKAGTLFKEIGDYLTLLSSLPRKTEALLQRVEKGDLEVRSPMIETQLGSLERSMRLMAVVIMFAALFVSGVQLFLAGYHEVGGVVGGSGCLILALPLIFNRK
jgi:predicted unusual protein kinase regulating ubiquinone biosynthesis (AarF/ABC1/UbiB family)